VQLSYLVINRLVAELSSALSGRRILEGRVSPPHDLLLRVEGNQWVLLSASPRLGRVSFVPEPELPDGEGASWIDSHLVDARIAAVEQPPFERIISFVLATRDRVGTVKRSRLIAELMGRYSNVVLVSEPGNRVVAALRRVRGRMNRVRQVLPGKPYAPPPPLGRPTPSEVTEQQLRDILSGLDAPLWTALAGSIAGVDRLTAREILYLANIGDGSPPDGGGLRRLHQVLQALYASPPFLEGAAVLPAPMDRGPEVCVLHLQHASAAESRAYETVSEAVEAASEESRENQETSSRKGLADRDLALRVGRLRKKLDRMQEDMREAERADRYEKLGNLLMASLHTVTPRASSVTVPDVFEEGAPHVDIALDPNKSPVENARDYDRRARKLRRSLPVLSRRLGCARAELEALSGYRDRLQALTGGPELTELLEELAGEGYISARRGGQRQTQQAREARGPTARRYLTSDGWTVLVGRNNRENDILTRSALAQDIFLHAQGCPGSHVILKVEDSKRQPPRKALDEAASLAAYWSKARGAKTVPVSFTQVRYVTKPRGAPPGLVNIRNEKTLFASPLEIPRADELPGVDRA